MQPGDPVTLPAVRSLNVKTFLSKESFLFSIKKKGVALMKKLIDKLYKNNYLYADELLVLLENLTEETKNYLHQKALEIRQKVYGRKIYLRALIEFTNYCRNNCLYCGIRAGNEKCERYRLSEKQILAACSKGYELGYRTFVLQGGEDPYYTDDRLVHLISRIKKLYPDCAVTLSIGERPAASYRKLFDAGTDRYLLRHETKSRKLYEILHPGMSFENREECLWNLKRIGYQVGAGFMVGLPSQTNEDYVKDLTFLKQLEPHMVGLGPFIPHRDTPLSSARAGTVEITCIMLSLVRLLLPQVLLPATTALGSLHPQGWEKGFLAGANVVMLNLSPPEVRQKYNLYNGKTVIPDEAAVHLAEVRSRITKAGFETDPGKGDHISFRKAGSYKLPVPDSV